MTVLHVLYLLAIAAEAASGALMGMRRRMDLFGLCVVGTVTALGGGSIRDVLLGHYPLKAQEMSALSDGLLGLIELGLGATEKNGEKKP